MEGWRGGAASDLLKGLVTEKSVPGLAMSPVESIVDHCHNFPQFLVMVPVLSALHTGCWPAHS